MANGANQHNKYAKRLLKLAAFLEKLPPERFDYGVFVGSDWKGKQDLSCGTVACAGGWAATMPEFRRLGLRLVFSREGVCGRGALTLNDRKIDPWSALASVFGVKAVYKGLLFEPHKMVFADSSNSYGPSPKEVAEEIRGFVAHEYGILEY